MESLLAKPVQTEPNQTQAKDFEEISWSITFSAQEQSVSLVKMELVSNFETKAVLSSVEITISPIDY